MHDSLVMMLRSLRNKLSKSKPAHQNAGHLKEKRRLERKRQMCHSSRRERSVFNQMNIRTVSIAALRRLLETGKSAYSYLRM